jgi:hypothetical protein
MKTVSGIPDRGIAMAAPIREHFRVVLHRMLDLALGEHASRVRAGNAAGDLSRVGRIGPTLLRPAWTWSTSSRY